MGVDMTPFVGPGSPETEALRALRAKVKMLPGKVAVLVKDREDGEIAIPDWVLAKAANLDIPPYLLTIATVVDVGPPRKGSGAWSGTEELGPGDTVACLPMEGLWINPADPDISLGALVPEGYQLRMYRGDVLDTVLLKIA